MRVPSARRIFSPPSLGAGLDELAAWNSDAADDRGSIGRSRSLLTLELTLSYGGSRRPDCVPEAHEVGKTVRPDRPSEGILGVTAMRAIPADA